MPIKSTFRLNFLFILITFSLLYTTQSATNFHFFRLIQCISSPKPQDPCAQWNQTTTLYRYSDIYYYCFPGDLYILTQDGPIQMKNVKINDQIWGFDIDKQKNGWVKIIAWLHHDPLSVIQYRKINVDSNFGNKNENNWNFLSSDYHNIAIQNNSKIEFKFLKQLQSGDQLIGQGQHQTSNLLMVNNIEQTIQKQGLYSPFTQSGTFYIFPQNFNLKSYTQNTQKYPMILVHSLSQLKNPISNFYKANLFIKSTNFLFGHKQPQPDQQYVNPLIGQFKIIFGNDWVEAKGRLIAHRYSSGQNEQNEQNEVQKQDQQQQSHDRYSSTTSSSSRNQKEQERKRRTIAVLAMGSIMNDILI